jgi:hypothetical protein
METKQSIRVIFSYEFAPKSHYIRQLGPVNLNVSIIHDEGLKEAGASSFGRTFLPTLLTLIP